MRRNLLDLTPLRRNRDFRYLWFGQVAGNLGRQITLIALPYQLFTATHAPLAIGALAVVNLIPLLVLTMGAGAVADTVDQRRLLLMTQSGLAITAVMLALLSIVPAPPIVAFYVVALLAASVSAIDGPVRKAALYRNVPRDEVGAASALEQTAMQAASVAGPLLGGVLILVGLPVAYGVEAAAFVGAMVTLTAVAPIPAASVARASLGSIVEGLAFARSHRAILGTFIIDLDAMIFGLPTALFPILALEVYHAGPTGLGLLAAAPAAGAFVGVLFGGWASRVVQTGRAVVVAVVVWGLAITGFGLATFSLPLALVMLSIAGAADVFSAVFRSTILQFATPDALRGRLSSIHLVVVSGGPRIGDVEATAVATVTSATISVLTGGLFCLVGAAVVARSIPELWRYRMASRERPATEPSGESEPVASDLAG